MVWKYGTWWSGGQRTREQHACAGQKDDACLSCGFPNQNYFLSQLIQVPYLIDVHLVLFVCYSDSSTVQLLRLDLRYILLRCLHAISGNGFCLKREQAKHTHFLSLSALTAPLQYCTTTSLHHHCCIAASLHPRTATPARLHHYTTVPLHNCTIAPSHHCIKCIMTLPLHQCITRSTHFCTMFLLYFLSAVW